MMRGESLPGTLHSSLGLFLSFFHYLSCALLFLRETQGNNRSPCSTESLLSPSVREAISNPKHAPNQECVCVFVFLCVCGGLD